MKLALVALIALAAAAAPPPSKAPTPPPQAPAPSKPAPKVSLPPPVVKSPVNDALTLCREACGKARYLCLQENDSETCDPSWQTCRASCARANP